MRNILVPVFVMVFAYLHCPQAAGGESPLNSGNGLTSEIAQQIKDVEMKLADGKTYSEIDGDSRKKVSDALGRMAAVVGQAQAVEELPQESRVSLHNDQELVNVILTKAKEDSRIVCERAVRTGSHRVTSFCMSVAERRRNRETSTDTLSKAQRPKSLSGARQR